MSRPYSTTRRDTRRLTAGPRTSSQGRRRACFPVAGRDKGTCRDQLSYWLLVRYAFVSLSLWLACVPGWGGSLRAIDRPAPSGVIGRVVDATNARPIPAATLAVGDQSAPVDADGRFTLHVEPGAWSVAVSAPGYQSAAVAVTIRPQRMTELDVRLSPLAPFHEEVDVVAPAEPAAESPATTAVAPERVVAVAGGGENVFRVLQTLPGVAGTDEFSGRLSVRGGGPDQNLTIMDGVEIYNPYRLFGLASAFNPETVERFELTTGAFSARYGDRLSSLLVVENREGETERRVSGSAAASLTDSNAILEGPLPKDRGSWLITGRRTYYDLIAERFTDNDLPSFEDLQSRTVLKLGGGRTLSLFSLKSREKTDSTFDFEDEFAQGSIRSHTRNDLLSATLYSPLGSRAWSRTIASSYKNTDSFDFGGSFRDEERRSNAVDDSGFSTANIGVTWGDVVRDDALRQEWGASLGGSSHVLDAGFEAHRLHTDIAFTLAGNRNETEGNGSSLQGGSSLPDEFSSTHTDERYGAWLEDRWQIGGAVGITAGVRADHTTINGRTDISPRVSAVWSLTPQTRLRAGLGLHTQSPGYEKLMQGDYFMDFSSSGRLPLANERARHALLAIERDLPGGWQTRVEGYYKGFDRLIVGRVETPEETQARVARYDFPADLAWSIPTDAQVTTFPTNDGRGSGWGFDAYVARRATSADTRLTGWASYTFGRAFRQSFGLTYPFDYDRRHALSVVANLRATKRLELGATIRLASGFPYTPALGLRVAATTDPDDPERLIPERDPAGNLVYMVDRGGLDNLNSARLPFYARVDARATYTPKWGHGNVRLYLDFINVLARDNVGIITSSLEHDPGADRPLMVDNPQSGMPFLPSFGVHVTFGARKPAAPRSDAPGQTTKNGPRRFAVAGRLLGSLGPGVDLLTRVSSRLNARLSLAAPVTVGPFDENTEAVDYDLKLELGSAALLLDWHPTGGRLHVSGGGMVHRHDFDVTAKSADSYRLGGVEYPAAEIGTLSGTVEMAPLSPYLGLGWGNPIARKGRFGLNVDAGVAFQRLRSVTLGITGPAGSNPDLPQHLRQEAGALRESLDGFRFYPVIGLSLSFGL
jgi:outer membrane cobalamin receptor